MSNDQPSQMSIQFSGNKLPIAILVGALSTLIASIIYATVWLTKLDDRVLRNYATTSENRQLVEQIVDILQSTQNSVTKNTIIQQEMLRRLEEVEDDVKRHH